MTNEPRRNVRWGLTWIVATCLGASCGEAGNDPASLLKGLRVLAIEAEPPEVAAGQQSTVRLLATDDANAAPTIGWHVCLLAPLAGQSVNPGCLADAAASGAAGSGAVLPLGEGPAVTVTMPAVAPGAFGRPDSTGGVYLTLVARVVGVNDRVDATYRLRLAGPLPPNNNPRLEGIVIGRAPESSSAVMDETIPVQAGDRLFLRAAFATDSAETYTVPQPDAAGGTRMVTEVLTTSWFATAGTFSVPRTGDAQPQTELLLDANLPAPGTVIDLYAVGRDERGGTTHLQRKLLLQ